MLTKVNNIRWLVGALRFAYAIMSKSPPGPTPRVVSTEKGTVVTSTQVLSSSKTNDSSIFYLSRATAAGTSPEVRSKCSDKWKEPMHSCNKHTGSA
eukprot:906623-Pyramimonas_sp.AAC.1